MRLLGAGLILLAACGVGGVNWLDRQRHLRCLRALCEALSLLHAELKTNRTPLTRLLPYAAEQAEDRASAFLRQVSDSLTQLGERSFSELWQEAACCQLSVLRQGELEELLSVGRVLGRFELQEQLNTLTRCESRLRARLEQNEARSRDEARLSLGLPAAAGALLVLLLL